MIDQIGHYPATRIGDRNRPAPLAVQIIEAGANGGKFAEFDRPSRSSL